MHVYFAFRETPEVHLTISVIWGITQTVSNTEPRIRKGQKGLKSAASMLLRRRRCSERGSFYSFLQSTMICSVAMSMAVVFLGIIISSIPMHGTHLLVFPYI